MMMRSMGEKPVTLKQARGEILSKHPAAENIRKMLNAAGQPLRNTFVFSAPNDTIVVRYVSTDIVWIGRHTILLDSGGYRTPTTLSRMNMALRLLSGTSVSIHRENRKWFVYPRGSCCDEHPIPFTDGITVERKTS